jgi:predicted NUDIX family phosphoesterase
MMTFIEAAYTVLKSAERPMTASEILHEAIASGHLTTKGRTPVKTLNARLSSEIIKNRSKSVFMRADGSRFALREWHADVIEKIVPRRTVALIDEHILVFDAKQLREYAPNNGLTFNSDEHHALLSQCFPTRRREAEERFDIIQLISVFVVRYRDTYLTYKRSKRLPEKRLQHSYSCFFGGHLTESDLMPLFRLGDPEQALYLLDRELSEELRLPQPPRQMIYKGLLYDPRSIVSTQHMGIVFCVELNKPEFEIGEKGFLTGPKFESIAEMRARSDEFENWSQLLITDELWRWN